MGLLKDFKAFAIKGNVVDLAIAVVIGAAFGKIITSFVEDLLMPLINPLIPGGGWQELTIGPGVKIGHFLAAIVNFIIIAFAVFLVFRGIQSYRRREEEKSAVAQAPTTTEKLLMEIRDSLKR
ncbi:MAG TPA: large conductance mechanosensitive channel protein MscL [Flavitalea sp.]|nr:large conductance mechanosensitive channel protein MscL [Flavitalea sp.]